MTRRVQRFIIQATTTNNASSKTAGTMTIDSAVWYLESALNLALARADLPVETFTLDSSVVQLTTISGHVSEPMVLGLYNSLHSTLSALPDDQHHLALINAEAAMDDALLQLTVYHYLATGGAKNLDTSFGPQDHWMWWDGINGPPGVNCPCASNPASLGLCSDKQIEKRLNMSVAIPHGYYFTNVTRWTISELSTDIPGQNYDIWDPAMLNPNDPTTSGDGYRDHYLYTCHKDIDTQQWLCSTCMGPAELEWYTQSTWDVMEYIRVTHTSRAPDPHLVFKLCKINGNTCPCFDGAYIHTALFEYGIIRQGGGNGSAL